MSMHVPVDISSEITFKTARSGGKGGQNVNKVETMVEGYFNIASSTLIDHQQKQVIFTKLGNRINADGVLQVRSQEHRSQLSNKAEVVKKMNMLIQQALKREKKRIPTSPTAGSRVKRAESKIRNAERKQGRKKIRYNDV